MKKLVVYQIDAFTKDKFGGNPAGVVLNADGLTDKQMQLIARELNNSETAFLFPPTADDHDGVIRYFTPLREVPTCGHATIAAMYARALEESLDSCLLRYKTGIGVLPFEITRNADDYLVTMTQGRFELSDPFSAQTMETLIRALGVRKDDLHDACPVQIASTGHSKVIIGIKSREALNSLDPNFPALTALSKEIGSNGYFAFTFDTNRADLLTLGRMFAPAIGIAEDPVTGNANGPLGGYLTHNRLVQVEDDRFEFLGGQGECLNRFGVVKVRVLMENGNPSVISILGNARMVFRTEMEV